MPRGETVCSASGYAYLTAAREWPVCVPRGESVYSCTLRVPVSVLA